MPNVSRRVVGSGVVFALMLALSPGWAAAQGKSGPRALDACGLATKVELEEGLKKSSSHGRCRRRRRPRVGVSTCMWATPNGRQTLSVTTYTPEALQRTQTKTLPMYYDALKTSNANNAGRPAIVLPGIARHASYFPAGWHGVDRPGPPPGLHRRDQPHGLVERRGDRDREGGRATRVRRSGAGARHEHPQRDSRMRATGRLSARWRSSSGFQTTRRPRPLARCSPALAGGLQRNVTQQGGLEALVGALTSGQHGRYLDDPGLARLGRHRQRWQRDSRPHSRHQGRQPRRRQQRGDDHRHRRGRAEEDAARHRDPRHGRAVTPDGLHRSGRPRVGRLDDRQHRWPCQLPRHEQGRVDGRRRRGVRRGSCSAESSAARIGHLLIFSPTNVNLLVGAIFAYVALQMLIGVLVSRSIRTEDDYLLAGRQLGPALATFSIFATWFGAETCVGSAGAVYADGPVGHARRPLRLRAGHRHPRGRVCRAAVARADHHARRPVPPPLFTARRAGGGGADDPHLHPVGRRADPCLRPGAGVGLRWHVGERRASPSPP